MGLGEWVQNTTADITVSLDITNPMVGNGSLSLLHPSTLAVRSASNLYLGAPFTKGFTKGKIQTLVRADALPDALFDSRTGAGVICLQSQLDLSGTVGDCYICYIGVSGTGVVNEHHFVCTKVDSGLTNSGATFTDLSDTNLITGASPGDFWPMEFEWNVDIPSFGGTRLTGRVGTLNSLDFNTLADVFDIIDSSSPFTASVAEGVMMQRNNTQSNPAEQYTLDETTVFELI